MSTTITLPKLGDAAQATLLHFFKSPGEPIAAGEPLCLALTTGFEWELPSPVSGTLAELLVTPGSGVHVDEPLAAIVDGDDADDGAPDQNGRVQRVSPLARKIAAQHQVELAGVVGSGPSQRVMRRDVVALVDPGAFALPGQAVQPASAAVENTVPARPTHPAPQPAAERAEPRPEPVSHAATQRQAQTAPSAILAVEVDMSAVEQYVERHQARLARRHAKLDHLACVASAVVAALGQHRLLNAAWAETDIILRGRIQLALVRGDGTSRQQVIADAASLSVQGIARRLHELATKETAPTPPSFTLTAHAGPRWSETPVTPGHSASLGLGSTVRRPCVVERGGVDTIEIRPMCWLTLSYDARVVDDGTAHNFLATLRRQVEQFSGI